MISLLDLNIVHSCLDKFRPSSLNNLSYSFLPFKFWIWILLNHLFILIVLSFSAHIPIFEKVLLWYFWPSLNRPWTRITFGIRLFPIFFDKFDSFVILVQLIQVSLPSFKHFQFVVHIMRVDIFIKWERMRYLHLHSFVCNYPIIYIKRTFLSFCYYWVYFDPFLFAAGPRVYP